MIEAGKASRLLALAWLAALPGMPLSAAGLPAQLGLYVGDSRVLQVNPRRVAVGNGAVVSVTTLP
ncbi:MAG: pilus assembly protein N-terminal domain-containing protein, partial [Steroidobacteraceae bacterium]|nr:pilus assembly protein N-terminal domain-containing protein [Steroidobacteraceae bacterium]